MPYIILLFSLMFIACGEVSNDGQEPPNELSILIDRWSELSDDERELRQSYIWLKSYFYRPERIKEFYEYEGLTEVDSMYSSLNDYLNGYRYTKYYKPDTSEGVYEGIVNSDKYYSFGFERGVSRDTLTIDDEIVIHYALIVTDVYPISPAAKAGLRKHDRLLSANGNPLTGITDTNMVRRYLRSDTLFEDLTVFEILRGTKSMALPAMLKEEVPIPTVYLDSLVGIPYIYVTEFTQKTNNPNGTYYEFKKYLEEIKGAETAIIDLRYNGGGSIWHCTAIAAELVPLNNELVYDVRHQSRDGKNVIDTIHYFAKDYLNSKGEGIDINWIILMSRYSASCSERFIVAVKYNRPETVLIGENSYGKGIGQVYSFTYLNGLAYITSLESFFPDGQPFHEIGIVPDIQVAIDAPSATYIDEIEKAALRFEPGRAVAKRSFASVQPQTLPPVRKSKKTDLGMYYLLH
jgi:C-terminal processing protease CtpA/Prc